MLILRWFYETKVQSTLVSHRVTSSEEVVYYVLEWYLVAAAATTNNMTGIPDRCHSCIVLIYEPKITTSTNFTKDDTTPNQIVNTPSLSMATNLEPVFFLNIE